MKYSEETTKYGGATVHLTCLTVDEYRALDNAVPTSVHCFPIHDDNVLLTRNRRGLDIIGGHIEAGETPEMAMYREAMEEAYITINKMNLIAAIQVDNRDNPSAADKGYPSIGYQLFYAVTDFELQPFTAEFECSDREYVPLEMLPVVHHRWLNTHDDLLKEMRLV